MRILLKISYLGTNYSGWQRQPNAVTVEGTILKALSHLSPHPLTLFCAGRTDKGVHALCQYAHFDTTLTRPWIRVNDFLPPCIRVLDCIEVPSTFHSRYDATHRQYTYFIRVNSLIHNPMDYDRVFHLKKDLNLQRIIAASKHILGTHDFAYWQSSGCCFTTTERTLTKFEVKRKENLITFKIKANSFLYNMVRNLLGSMCQIGLSIYQPEDMAKMRDGEGSYRRMRLPPHGLYLDSIDYDVFSPLKAL